MSFFYKPDSQHYGSTGNAMGSERTDEDTDRIFQVVNDRRDTAEVGRLTTLLDQGDNQKRKS